MVRNWKSSRSLAIMALIGVTAVWGWTFIGVKDAVSKMPVMDFLAVRFTVAAVILLFINPRKWLRIKWNTLWQGLIIGFLLGMSYITQTYGLRTVSPSVSGFITGMGVVFTPVFLWAIMRRSINSYIWMAVGLTVGGLALLSLHGWAFGMGELLTLACAVFVALYVIALGEWSARHDTYQLTVIQIFTVAVMCLVFAAPGGITMPPDSSVWVTVGITAVLASDVAFFIQTWAQTILSPSLTAVVMTMEPVFAGLFSITLGGERPTVRLVLGAGCVLAAMLIAQLKTAGKTKASSG
jgi:drug/metabolite transporter (DMT)-like permease